VQSRFYLMSLPQTDAVLASLAMVNCSTTVGVEVMTQFGKAQSVWRDLVRQGAACSRYQHYSWMANWWDHIGSARDVTPHITILKDQAGKPILLLPLLRRRLGLLHAGFFIGGKHTNFNLPIWRPDLLNDPATSLKALVRGLRATAPRVDLLILQNQPATWQGMANPLLRFAHAASPSQSYGGSLQAEFEALKRERMSSKARKKLAQKQRRLSALGPVTYFRAETREEIDGVLDVFFRQKANRMRELGFSDAFDEPCVKEFVTASAHEIDMDTGGPVIELYAAKVGDTIVATFGGIVASKRFSGMFISMAGVEYRHCSPGELLLNYVVQCCCERGFDRFDLGIGEGSYKRVYCGEVEALFDAVVPITIAGHIAAPFWRVGLALKRKVKQSDKMLRAARYLSQLMGRHSLP
jgi:CelD/BcsL family acetyltransferase involved in cellulose biosynthesis